MDINIIIGYVIGSLIGYALFSYLILPRLEREFVEEAEKIIEDIWRF